MPSGIRNKLMAAVSMLLVSTIMMVSTTYAWFTLSTAPEVKNISTTVAGNGSLEIALMPTSGSFADISKSGNSGTNAGGTAALTLANTSWGNLITLSDGDSDPYGLNKVTLNPASLNKDDLTKPLAVAEYGYDGRINRLASDNISAKAYGETSNQFDASSVYGVRAIGETNNAGAVTSTYGYVVDFAVRLNTDNNGTAGKLKLQTDAAQRIYSDGTNADTMGGGSYMEFSAQSTKTDGTPEASGMSTEQIQNLMSAIRVTFIQNYGNAVGTTTQTILGTAKVDVANATTDTATTTVKAPLKLYTTTTNTSDTGETTTTDTEVADGVLMSALNKNQAVQISALVWLDGAGIKNADVAAETLQSAVGALNLQFSTDVELHPSVNTELKDTATQTIKP